MQTFKHKTTLFKYITENINRNRIWPSNNTHRILSEDCKTLHIPRANKRNANESLTIVKKFKKKLILMKNS